MLILEIAAGVLLAEIAAGIIGSLLRRAGRKRGAEEMFKKLQEMAAGMEDNSAPPPSGGPYL